MEWRGSSQGVLTNRTFCRLTVLILLQFLFKFAQGQGPGTTDYQHFTVYENQKIGTEVGQIQTQQSYSYSFSKDLRSKPDNYFELSNITGKITTKVVIDRESLNLPENQFDILVLAKSVEATHAVEISIQVLDENDNRPTFPKDLITVSLTENSPVGVSLQIQDTATDLDDGLNAQIKHYEKISGQGPFKFIYNPEIYGDLLIIVTTGPLDRESVDEYEFIVSARDEGTPSLSGTCTVQITISDENDHPPIFDPSEYQATVNETDSIDTFVVQVVASDRDTGENAEISYHIVGENEESGQFKILKNTGEIFTQKEPLSCKNGKCMLNVEAYDHGTPQYTGRAFVYISIVDTNNHDPVIRFGYQPGGNTEFSSVNEDAKHGTAVAAVFVTDLDSGVYGQTTAKITAGNELKHFLFDKFAEGLFQVVVNGDGVLDRERQDMYNLTIQAKDSGNPPRSASQYLIIHVNDINDHAPVFVNKRVQLRISETTKVNSFIASMLATDGDTGNNAKLTYTFLNSNQPSWFHINPDTGLVTTIAQLHYQEKNNFRFNISVNDGALKPLYDYAELEISIWDENDMTPTFTKNHYEASLEENLPSGVPVTTELKAVDYDSGDNGTVTYRFHSHVDTMYPGTFYLDSNSGLITTIKALDREEISRYVLKVIASDKGPAPLSSTATVTLEVTDVNDNSPVFYPNIYYAKVIEGQGPYVIVVQVSAKDPDEGANGKILYSFSGSDFGKFSIDTNSGAIQTTQVLRKADRASYSMTVVANDQMGQKSDEATVVISVLSPTDSSPHFDNNAYNFRIPEDPGDSAPTYIGANIGQVTAQHSGSSVDEYKISDGDPLNQFNLNSRTGWIRRAKAIDRESFSIFLLKIVAKFGNTYAETVVTVKVLDNNDNAPKFANPVIELDLVENWPVGHYIHIVSATDADEEGSNSRIVYSIQRDQNNMFGIVRETGLLFLRKPVKVLGATSTSVTVVAMDSGTPANSATQELQLTVKDVNNHTPKFGRTTYEKSLIESHPVNSRFFSVAAIDDDLGRNGELIYNITRGNEDRKFGIFPDGYLFIAKQLDREVKDLYKLSVIATDQGDIRRSSECNITIHITDDNDNKPIFVNGTYSYGVLENKPVGTAVGYVKAADLDMGRNAEIIYSLDANGAEHFRIDPQTGEIMTLKVFDREPLSADDYAITFDVIAKDNGLNSLQDVATVRVTILDENDNPPVFKKPIYHVSVFENAPPYSNLTVVKATDLDSGINSIVTYSIIGGNEDENFIITQTTGQISINKPLDRETKDSYELTIVATDSGSAVRHSTTAVIKIQVADINDNFPLFAQTSLDVSVSENLEPGTMVGHFPATDLDLGVNGEIRYSMSGQDDDQTFGIDLHTGKIYLQKPLDYEQRKSYRLNVTATDNGVPPLPYYIRFIISVEDVNDNAPEFKNEPYIFKAVEGSQGSSVSSVYAEDLDSDKNGEVQYHIAYEDPPLECFRIVKSTGEIYKAKDIDREETSQFILAVVATDQAEDVSKRLSTETRVIINIEDTNDNDPLITSFNAIAVPYQTPKNELLTTIQVSDKDIGDNGRYLLSMVQNDGDRFSLDSNTGRFYLISDLPSMPLKYTLAVKTRDYGTPNIRSSEIGITVLITKNTDGPVFQGDPYNGEISESDRAETSILTVRATSTISSPVEYYITNITLKSSGAQVGRYFEIGKSSGLLTNAAVLDREEVGKEFEVEIYAIETGISSPRTSFTKATVQLRDINDTPPRFSRNFYSVDVDEDVRPDFVITRVTVYDNDSVGGLQLNLNVGPDVKLKINHDGTIVSTGPLDREAVPQYNLRVTATDGIQSSSCWVRINLLDKNDNAPTFTRSFYSFDVNEDTLIGTTVGSVRAHDPDEGPNGSVQYALVSAWANNTFQLDAVKGTLRLVSVLDFEENQLYTLSVRATDQGDPAQSSTVIVYFNVKDTNDNAPLFEHGVYDRAIRENVAVGTSVIQVLATDVDSGLNGELRYSLPEGNMAGHFGVDPLNGTIFTTAKLDRESIPSYQLDVMATDMAADHNDRKSSSVQVSISLDDVNDFTPEFTSPAVIGVRENQPNGTVVHQIQVRDLDEGINSNVEFSISSKSGGAPFTLGITDGKLRVNTDLDRETVQNYTLFVTAKDRGSPSLSATQKLVVKIDDVNDHRPVFSPEYYDKSIKEDVDVGTILLPVSATDDDAGLNGIVRYFIISGDDNNDFSIDQSSGVIRVQKNLDFERITEYSLIIQAEDSGVNMLYATATVSITVEDVNDNEPLFLDSPYIGYVHENMEELPVHVLQVSARDDDSKPFNLLNYAIREGNQDLFNMSSTTGEIMSLRKLDREVTPEYVMTIIATDSGGTGRGLTGTGTVTIYVEDVNDNPPVFEHVGSYIAHILEDATEGTEVIVVKATDDDEGVNAQIIYSLTDSMNDAFTIYPESGRITTMARLDRETVSLYELVVVARDVSLVPLSTTTTVRVFVDDVNDNAPVFDKTSYSRTVMAPAGQGTFILGATAKDADIGANGLIEYHLIQSGSQQPFMIDRKTGVITATQSLSSGSSHSFQIEATDKGLPAKTSSAPVTVTISLSSGVAPPTFNQIPTNLNVMENLALDTEVIRVMAQSTNGADVTYAIAGGNTGQAFGIDGQTGRIFVAGSVDYEVTHQYRLWIEARNTGSNPVSQFAEVVIGIEDENDNEPRFSETRYNTTIMENTRSFVSIITVTATDVDSGDNGRVTYTLAGENADVFMINASSGEITTFEDLDREKMDSYSLTVVATDSGSKPKSSTSSVRIQILDANDEPPIFQRLFRVKVPENLEVGSFVLRVTSSDKDVGTNAIATYTLTIDGDGMFSIDSVSGNVTLRKPLDAEKISSYTLQVLATDSAHDVKGYIEVDVTDVNDKSPVIQHPYSFDFPEKSSIGEIVGQLRATDDDVSEPNNRVLFSLKLASDMFDLDSDTGRIISLEELTYFPTKDPASPLNRHELVVIAKDLGTPVKSTEMTIHINVVDYNDHAPQFEVTDYKSAVPERTNPGTSILKVTAKDEEDHGQNAAVEYVAAGGSGSEYFSVDRYLGIVSVKASLSGMINQELILTIKVEDLGLPKQSSTVDVHLYITDDNRLTPAFETPASKQISVKEDISVGSLIETFKASDNDPGLNGDILYEITAGNGDGLFEIDQNLGTLSVAKPLDYEKSHKYQLSITARDKGLYSKEVTILYVVDLTDVNDNDPEFVQGSDKVYVKENTPQGVSIYQAVATDQDSGNNKQIEYAIVEDSQARQKFIINPSTGIVTTKGDLDYETKDMYSMTIMALNPNSDRKSTMSLTVYIEGVNEDIPRFVQDAYYFSISESAEAKTSVGAVSAIDSDDGEDGIINFFLIGDSNDKGFKVDPRTGVIYVAGRPDYESSPNIKLQVLAKNWGSVKGNDTDTCTVHISIQDANDPPRFSQEVYQASIKENTDRAGVSVLTVVAEDNDFEPSDRQFSYLILSGDSMSLFQIDPSTGYISTSGKGTLDREVTPMFNITVGAKDNGTPPETGSAIVQIHVADVNDNGPEFVNFTATIAEGSNAPLVVTSLTQYTTDPDDISNQGPYKYTELPGTHMEYEYFSINQNTGEVRRLRDLDRELTAEFLVPVVVTDSGTPRMSSTLSFRVTVLDINDQPPTPRFLTVFVSLYDGRIQGTIADVRPNDQDLPESGSFRCTLTNISTPFVIQPNSCQLQFKEYPTSNSYTLSVSGSDGTFDAVKYEVFVKISAFNNNTLDHSTVIQVADTTKDSFMNNSYSRFMASLRRAFEPEDEVYVYGLVQQPTGDLLLFLAVKQGTRDLYYKPDILKQRLEASKNITQSESTIFILNVAYTTCAKSFCRNSGICQSQVKVQSTNEISESSYQSLFNPTLSLDHYCSCLPQYTGPQCEQQATPCGDNVYCQNDGTCVNSGNGKSCQCLDTWTGRSCEIDVNECERGLCQNGANCENTKGDFICHCPDGFYGDLCQNGSDNCRPNPCDTGSCRNTMEGYQCECPYGIWGDHCEYNSRGFSVGSYMEIARLDVNRNDIEVVFATQSPNALLLYNPSTTPDSPIYLALEIINGRVRFSVSLGVGVELQRRITVTKPVSTGAWFKVKAVRDGQTTQVRVEDCPENGGPCTPCQVGTSCYGRGMPLRNSRLEVGDHVAYVGGVNSIDTILNNTRGQLGSHDFVGCVRSFLVNGRDVLRDGQSQGRSNGILAECPRKSSSPTCDSFTCENSGLCVSEWEKATCHCTAKHYGERCEKELQPFGFASDTRVSITPRESARRDALIAAASTSNRRRRATEDSHVLVRFRTLASQGILLFTSTFGNNRYSVLSIFEGKLMFTVKLYGGSKSTTLEDATVSDGNWHNATVLITGAGYTVLLDGQHQRTSSDQAFKFSDLDVQQMSLGGAPFAIPIDNNSMKDFDGCISVFELDGQALPMNGTTDFYTITPVGEVSNGCSMLCANNPCDGGACSVTGESIVCEAKGDDSVLSIGIIVVIVFFIILIIVIIIVFIVFRRRKVSCLKSKLHTKQNGATMSKSANSSGHSHQDSGYSENNIDELIIRNHIAQELAHNQFNPMPGGLMKPDILKSDRSRPPMPLEIEDGTVIIDNASDLTHLRDLNGEMPEHYDLENASSIAPSDIDVVDHYRHFHNGGKHRRKTKSSHSQNSSSRHNHSNQSHQSNHSHGDMRDSPNLLTSVPLNDLAMDSPNSRNNRGLMNQLSRQSPNVRNSPMNQNINMHNHNMPVTELGGQGSRTTSERSLASHRSKNSSQTPHKPKRQMLPNGRTPTSSKIPNNNYKSDKFLTLEEVDRLNARKRESPASLMEAFSTSSENNTRKMHRPPVGYQDTSVLLEPPESSSDDSANDSFTCSEFEYENDKQRNDFDPDSHIFSNLTEVENENEEGSYHNKNFKPDGLDSGGNSFSSNNGSADESNAKLQQMKNAFNWDDLLNWGPKFEKLVGVFTDIALLPDADAVDLSELEGKMTDREEYV